MEFIFIFAVSLFQVILPHIFKVVEIVRTFRVHAFVEDEVFAFFLLDEGVATVRAAQFQGREAAFGGRESGGADLTEKLSFGTIVFVKEGLWGITAWACRVLGDVTCRVTADRADVVAIAFIVVRDEIFESPTLSEVGDQRERIDLEFLVFGGMGIIKSPLFQRDISADKMD